MKILLITEKCTVNEAVRDGGARLVDTIKRAFGKSLSIMQFGPKTDLSAMWSFDYPFNLANRFESRMANANFIAAQVKSVEQNFTHVIFIHVSMQFGLVNLPLREGLHIWTFPMFLTPSYLASGEIIPASYITMERLTLLHAPNILSPSYHERRQLIEFYSIAKERIHVIPRGIEMQLLDPKVRFLNGPPKFCSLGSIKPQKNILGLIRLFAVIQTNYPGATLRIIGAIQNFEYYATVLAEIQCLGLNEMVEMTGYIPPNNIALAIEDSHIHLSASNCETFGRSIFETLASGLPNIARLTDNAAAEFLAHLPYARFVDDDIMALTMLDEMLSKLSVLSAMALEIGCLYDDEILSRLLVAKICNKDCMAISDFDGTLFHKKDPEKTLRCIKALQCYPIRVICSARSTHELIDKLTFYNLKVDFIIAYSGASVTNGHGQLLWITPIEPSELARLELLMPHASRIEVEGKVLQLIVPVNMLPNVAGLRFEIYQDIAYLANDRASKFHAVHQLLRYINWFGQVCTFGDRLYDAEILTYFDGVFITSSTNNDILPIGVRQRKEI